MSSTTQLRTKQLVAIRQMLAPPPQGDSSGGPISWKVLVLDSACKELLAPLISVNALRRLGVTLHLGIDQPRERLDDVSAVYFCQATEENAKIIAEDAKNETYGRFELHFSSRASRKVIELIARELGGCEKPSVCGAIGSVWDENLEFTALEERLFTLGMRGSFAGMCSSDENVVNQLVERAARGLFSVCATLGVVPVIRAATGGVAEAVARSLSAMLADHHSKAASMSERSAPLSSGSISRATTTTTERPLLLVYDRFGDLETALRHTETYQALLDDVLEHANNQVSFEDDDSNGKKQSLELSHDTDAFFAMQAARSFPDVIDASSEELSLLREKERALRARSSTQQQQDISQANAGVSASRNLSEAVSELPAILDRKKMLESHTSILGAIMKRVVSRQVPRYFEAEEGGDDASLGSLLGSEGPGSLNDKLRLLLVRTEEESDFRFAELAGKVVDKDAAALKAGLAALAKVRALKKTNSHRASASTTHRHDLDEPNLTTSNGVKTTEGDNRAVSALAQGLFNTASSGTALLLNKAAKGTLRMLGNSADSAGLIKQTLTNLFEARPSTEHDSYLYLDPKQQQQQSRNNAPAVVAIPPKCASLDCIVFVVGGGCYREHHALANAFADGPRTVLYGATELLNADALLGQMTRLVH